MVQEYSRDEAQQSSEFSYQSVVRWSLFAWLGVAIVLTGINASHAIPSFYSYKHGWISAHFSVGARTFANFGITAFGGVPVVNNPPFGVVTEAYLHWPPVFNFLLAAVYCVFGVSEASSHALMFVLLAVNTLLLGLLVHRCFGFIAAQFACLTWLGCGVVGTYAHLVWNDHLMMAFVFLSLLGFINASSSTRWAVVGASSYALAIATSWEAVPIFPGLLALSLWIGDKGKIRLAGIYALIGVAVPALILVNSAHFYPQQVAELWQRALFRMGLAHEYVSAYATGSHRQFALPSAFTVIRTIVQRHFDLIGILPLAAVAWLLASTVDSGRDRRHDDGLVVFAGLVSMWWLWVIVFHSHIFIHDCHIYDALPAAAFAAGAVGQALVCLVDRLLAGKAWSRKVLVVVVIPLILLAPLASAARNSTRFIRRGTEAHLEEPEAFSEVQFGLDLLRNTEPGAVVITPDENMVPVYYSQRHHVQGVNSDQDVQAALVHAVKNFPGSPLYLAIPTASAQLFPASLAKGQLVGRYSGMTLVRVGR
uniref:Glycosyltransferase RgtA/B/C/D-like domain-containing protein n=1 Tax=Solibacter usitatus (strain Ellin6076) TaxID=234267 RepID=Q01XM2_SOLUE